MGKTLKDHASERFAHTLRLTSEDHLALRVLSELEERPVNSVLVDAVRIYVGNALKNDSGLREEFEVLRRAYTEISKRRQRRASRRRSQPGQSRGRKAEDPEPAGNHATRSTTGQTGRSLPKPETFAPHLTR